MINEQELIGQTLIIKQILLTGEINGKVRKSAHIRAFIHVKRGKHFYIAYARITIFIT